MVTQRMAEGAKAIGHRLREIRRDRGATLAEVSTATGVSISALSKIENAQISASYDILKRICDGLGLAIEDVVSSGEKTVLSGRKTMTRVGEGDQFRSDQYDYRVHAGEITRKAMVPLEMVIRARNINEFDHWSQHHGEEFIFVIDGTIEVHTEHYAPFRVEAGESAYFDSSMRHIFLSLGASDARILSVSHDPATAPVCAVARFMIPAAREVQAPLAMERFS